jgi:hypothetical protein
MASFLALFSSLLWGTADFFGGKLTKKYKSLAVTGVSQSFGLLFGLVIILITSSWFAPTLSWSNYFLPGVFAGTLGFRSEVFASLPVFFVFIIAVLVLSASKLTPN